MYLINDTPISALGLRLARGAPRLGELSRQYAFTPWAGRAGGVGANLATTPPVVISLGLDVPSTATTATRQAIYDRLAHLLTGTVEVSEELSKHLVMRARPRLIAASLTSPTYVNTDASIAVELVAEHAMRFEREPLIVSVGSTPVPILVGQLAHGGQCRIMGTGGAALSSPVTLTARNFAGKIIGQLTVTPALATNESCVLDIETLSLQHLPTTTVTAMVPQWLTSGSGFAFGPQDAVPHDNAWPTLEASAGAVVFSYRRVYLP